MLSEQPNQTGSIRNVLRLYKALKANKLQGINPTLCMAKPLCNFQRPLFTGTDLFLSNLSGTSNFIFSFSGNPPNPKPRTDMHQVGSLYRLIANQWDGKLLAKGSQDNDICKNLESIYRKNRREAEEVAKALEAFMHVIAKELKPDEAGLPPILGPLIRKYSQVLEESDLD